MRGNPSSVMQKTYDECYLACSTAIYFESQNNEAEALRSWRNALDQIYYHNAFRVPANYRAKNETERALQQSLHQLELQCKERVDLLDALRRSRDDAEAAPKTKPNIERRSEDSALSSSISGLHITKEEDRAEKWLGRGTIPPMDYTDISRPSLPKRPSPSPRAISNPDNIRSLHSPQSSNQMEPLVSSSLQPAKLSRTSRTPSPQKKSRMLRTLRTNSRDSKPSKIMEKSNSRPPAAAKAATQAWGSFSGATPKSQIPPTDEETVQSSDRCQSTRSPVFSSDQSRKTPYPKIRAMSSSETDDIEKSPGGSSRAMRYQSNHSRRPESEHTWESTLEAIGQARASQNPGHREDTQSKENTGELYTRSADAIALADRTRHDPPGWHYDPHTRSLMRRSSPVSMRSNQPSYKDERVVNRKALPTTVLGSRESTRSDVPSVNTIGYPGQTASGKAQIIDHVDTTLVPEQALQGVTEETSYNSDRVRYLFEHPLPGIEAEASKQILNEIVVHGDEVHWSDIAGLDIAKAALKETVVYPFLRPDLFMGLREPARGMLLFGPPGTGKTMLARAVATESKSTFFAISASSLTSKFLGESEKLVKALFVLAKALAPSIIFVDEIDSLLSARADTGEHEATRRIKTEFLIQWSDLARAAAGKEQSDSGKHRGDASRVLVLAATNLPWAIDEAARRRFVRRQYIPLPEAHVRKLQLETLLSHQKHTLMEEELDELVGLTDGFSGSDVTALAKDAAMGPLRSLGEQLLHMTMEDIRPIGLNDFKRSLNTIRPSVSKVGLKRFEDWAMEFGERGG